MLRVDPEDRLPLSEDDLRRELLNKDEERKYWKFWAAIGVIILWVSIFFNTPLIDLRQVEWLELISATVSAFISADWAAIGLFFLYLMGVILAFILFIILYQVVRFGSLMIPNLIQITYLLLKRKLRN